MKRLLILAVFGFVGVWLWLTFFNVNNKQWISTVDWIFPHTSVEAQTNEADLIVRVHVITTSSRILKQTMDIFDANGQPTGEKMTQEMSFTDSEVKISTVYKGAANGNSLLVMQPGNMLERGNFFFGRTDLLQKGEEYILFLKDVSDDALHGKGRKLFRLINPASQYRIVGESIINLAQAQDGELPSILFELESQIRSSVDISRSE